MFSGSMRGAGLAFLPIAGLLAGGAGRLAYLEQTRGTRYRAEAGRGQTAWVRVPSQRGNILDARGRILAGSVRRPWAFVDPNEVARARYAASSIAPVLRLRAHDLETLILERKKSRFVRFERELDDAQLRAFNLVRQTRGLRAFGVLHDPKRIYPYDNLAAAVLGRPGKGSWGIEQAFDEFLSGADGRRAATVDVLRRRVRPRVDQYVPPRDGASVVLTIDAYIQEAAERALRKAALEHEPQWAVAVAMDPRSGEVLAMATWRGFDPAQPLESLDVVRNRAVMDSYEPGSVFKPFIAACAVEAGVARLDDVFKIGGPTRRFGARTMHDTKAHDRLPLWGVVSKSSNIGMGLLADLCGNQRLSEYVSRFGFGRRTGIRLPGEHPGQVFPLRKWTKYSTQSIPIGQEIAVTPIQLVTAFSAICNGGVLYQPRIVRGIVSATGETLEDNSRPIPVRRVLSAATAREFRMGALVEVVRDRADVAAFGALEEYHGFGKTGTAQIARTDGRGLIRGAYVGSFMGGAPADDPRVAVLVSLYRPSAGKYYGGTVAGPAAAEIIADVMHYLRVPPSAPTDGFAAGGSTRERR